MSCDLVECVGQLGQAVGLDRHYLKLPDDLIGIVQDLEKPIQSHGSENHRSMWSLFR